MRNKQRYCWQIQNHVRIANSRGRSREITIPSKSSYFFMVLWHGRSRKKCVERYCELANKTTQQLYKVSTPCIDDHHFKEEEMKSVGELSKVCSQNCSEMLILGTYWKTWYFYGQWTHLHVPSRNGPKLVTNDKVVWSLTFIIHVNTNSIAMLETLSNNADWDCFKTPIWQEILRTRNLHRVEHFAFLQVIHLFQ